LGYSGELELATQTDLGTIVADRTINFIRNSSLKGGYHCDVNVSNLYKKFLREKMKPQTRCMQKRAAANW
ncbi:hypothetical protein, partial [Escherichia coli]|uniref:hypothetical protein n=1 Tax=Escherichia coli TaxID=562 RepID=UPI001E5A7BD3